MDRYTKHFRVDEMACPCPNDCGAFMDQKFMEQLEALRSFLKFPFNIEPGGAARCRPYHHDLYKKIGKTPPQNSYHISEHIQSLSLTIGARAADVGVYSSMLRYRLLHAVMHNPNLNGIGIAGTFIHIDNRPQDVGRVWTY